MANEAGWLAATLGRLRGRPKEDGRVRVEPFGADLVVPGNQSILETALAAGLPFPHGCKVGTCTSCKSRLVSGRVTPIRDFSYVLSGEDLRAGYILACQAKVRKGEHCVLEVEAGPTAPNHPLRTVTARLAAWRPLTHDILEVELVADAPLAFTAGQYAELRPEGFDRGRSFSFAHRPRADDHSLRFFVRRVAGGAFTQWLFETAQAGQTIELRGPLGSFYLREAAAPLLCVAGGSGLAPLLAILEQALEAGTKRAVTLLFGARTQRDLYALEAIAELQQRWPAAFAFHPVLSEEPPDSTWHGLRGLVTEHLHTECVPELAACHAYLCGPPAMIDAALARLSQAGIPHAHLHYDKFLDARDLLGDAA